VERGWVNVWTIPDGARDLPASRWREYKKVSGVIVGRVPLDSRTSVYAKWGDVFAIGCLSSWRCGAWGCSWCDGRREWK